MATTESIEQLLTVPQMIQAYKDGKNEYIEELYEKGFTFSYQLAKQKIQEDEKANNIARVVMNRIIPSISSMKNPMDYYLFIVQSTLEIIKNDSIRESVEDEFITLEEYQEKEKCGKIQTYENNLSEQNEKLLFRKQVVRKILLELEEREREAAVLYYYKEKTIQEISNDLKISYSETVNYLFEAKKKIKDKIIEVQREEGIKLY